MAFGLDINCNEQKLTTDKRATIFPQHDKCKKMQLVKHIQLQFVEIFLVCACITPPQLTCLLICEKHLWKEIEVGCLASHNDLHYLLN